MFCLLGLAKSQQSVKTGFGKGVCALKAAEIDFPSSVPRRDIGKECKQSQSIFRQLSFKVPTRVVITRVVPTRVVLT
jgi:hypothetical protein